MNQWKTERVGFLYIIESNDKLITFKNLDSLQIKLNYPYFYDVGNILKKKNNISDEKLHQTFLLDKSNRVILVGNPTKHIGIEKLYTKELTV